MSPNLSSAAHNENKLMYEQVEETKRHFELANFVLTTC